MDIKPQGLKLIVKPLEKKEEVMTGGIIAPPTANADLREGEVVAVGADLYGKLNKGDIVLYPDKRGVSQFIDGEWMLWLDADVHLGEVWGVISKDK